MEANKKRLRLKINPQDNTITIKKVKDSFSREEVIELCTKAVNDYIGNSYNFLTKDMKLNSNWIEQNL